MDAAYSPVVREADLERALRRGCPPWLRALVRATRDLPGIRGRTGRQRAVEAVARSRHRAEWVRWVAAHPLRPHAEAIDAAAWGMAKVLAGGEWGVLPDATPAPPTEELIGDTSVVLRDSAAGA